MSNREIPEFLYGTFDWSKNGYQISTPPSLDLLNAIVAIIHDSLISLENVMMLKSGDIKTKIATNGYSVFTWMG